MTPSREDDEHQVPVTGEKDSPSTTTLPLAMHLEMREKSWMMMKRGSDGCSLGPSSRQSYKAMRPHPRMG